MLSNLCKQRDNYAPKPYSIDHKGLALWLNKNLPLRNVSSKFHVIIGLHQLSTWGPFSHYYYYYWMVNIDLIENHNMG